MAAAAEGRLDSGAVVFQAAVQVPTVVGGPQVGSTTGGNCRWYVGVNS